MELSDRQAELLALVAHEELSGREVAQEYKKLTGRVISYGTLYTTFRRLKEAKLVNMREKEDEDGRVRYFEITLAGRAALRRQRDFYSRMATFGLVKGFST